MVSSSITNAADSNPSRPAFRPEREIRFAVVLYGGVSLAIYINGVVQELFRLVRATAPVFPYPEDPLTQTVYFATDPGDGNTRALKGTERVYRKIAQLLPTQQPLADVPDPDATADVRTRFVVDILSGSSAGGINGIFLGKALANQQDIDALQSLWVEQGDIGILLNDKASYKDLPRRIERQDPPRSLLNGQRLMTKALNALREMAGTAEKAEDETSPSYVEQLDLSVTTTDLQGLRMPIALSDRLVYEERHRHVFRFAYATDAATGYSQNDFRAENDGILAFAARATSSFPFAFEGVLLNDILQVDRSLEARFGDWGDSFFPEYVSRGADFRRYAFADGGYLDNKPFTHATETLRRRRADVPVDRKLIYIEPDPGGIPTVLGSDPLPADEPEPRPDVIENVIDALTALPRAEPIRDDIQAIFDRNEIIEELRRMTLAVEIDFRQGRDPFGVLRNLPPDVDDWLIDTMLGGSALFHRSYRRLRALLVADALAETLALLTGVRAGSDMSRAVALITRVWIEQAQNNLNPLLYAFDVAYRLRRLTFVQDRINELLRQERRSHDVLEMLGTFGGGANYAFGSISEEADGLRALKRALNDIAVEIRVRAHSLRQSAPPDPAVTRVQLAAEAFASYPRAILHVLEVDEPDRERREERQRDRALEFAWAQRGPLDTLAGELSGYLREALETAEAQTESLLEIEDGQRPSRAERTPGDGNGERSEGNGRPLVELSPQLLALIRGYYEHFDSFDAVSLPLVQPHLGETNPVEVVRISPQDATALIDETSPGSSRRKLAGTSVNHFGGFLDRTWRQNDILWGRLDGAERIIASVVPASPARDRLRDEAHAAILREELLDDDRGPLTDLIAGALLRSDVPGGPFPPSALERLRLGDSEKRTAMIAALQELPDEVLLAHVRTTYEVPRSLDGQTSLGVAGRATRIAGQVLEETSRRRSIPSHPWFWLARIGRLAWGIAEVAMPRKLPTIPGILFRYWSQIAFLLAILLIVFGTLGVAGAQKVGWLLLFIVLGARSIVWLSEALLASPRPAPLSARAPPITAQSEGAIRVRHLAGHALWVAAIGIACGLVVVLIGLLSDAMQRIGWIIVFAAGAVAAVAALARFVLPSPRRAFAQLLALLAIAIVVLAGLEVSRHGGSDISAFVGRVLPGDATGGFESYVRDGWDWFVSEVWSRVWPW
jgi:patatin-related protein